VKPVTLVSLLPWIGTCAVVLVLLEFLDGIVYLTVPAAYDDELFEQIVFSLFSALCAAGALFLLFAGTFLLRKVRVGDRLKSAPPVDVRVFLLCSLSLFLSFSLSLFPSLSLFLSFLPLPGRERRRVRRRGAVGLRAASGALWWRSWRRARVCPSGSWWWPGWTRRADCSTTTTSPTGPS
jgi:hypothetical protein